MYLIFDFDGTLVNSFKSIVKQFNHLAIEFDFRTVDENNIHTLRDLSSLEIINYLQIPLHKIPNIIYQMRKNLHSEISNLIPIEHLPPVLKNLYDAGFSLGILTSNSQENVKCWLEQHNMTELFKFIHVESNFFTKKNILKKILKIYQIDKAQTFYIGDETRDIEAAKQSDIFSIAVTWGFNSEKALLRSQPHHIARKPEDILTICIKYI